MKTYNKWMYAMLGVAVALMMMVVAFGGGVLLAPRLAAKSSIILQSTNALEKGLNLVPAISQDLQITTTNQTETAKKSNLAQLSDGDVVAAYEKSLTEIYKNALPSVVYLNVTKKVAQKSAMENFDFNGLPSPFENLPDKPQEFINRAQGSGFVWDKEGHILTNNHVVADATEIEVVFANDKRVAAKLVATDPDADLAMIKVDLPASELTPLALGDSDKLEAGQLAIAIGNPFGQDFTMTSGIISAVGRTIQSGTSQFSIPEVIQTDAPINPGNSGGPLLNRLGEVIGINTQIMSQSGASAGIGFAVPINIAKQVAPSLMKGQNYDYAWLGISGTTLNAEVADFLHLPKETTGAIVLSVAQDGPADKAGLQGSDKTLKVNGEEFQLGGDIITAINGQPVKEMNDLITYLVDNAKPQDVVTLDVIHPTGKSEQVKVTLGVRPKSVAEDNSGDK